ncbi:PP2C family protein-serine/threonine phosphatase [Actinomadura sp. 9N215]|uniref:PP2C family protein-serine/threonine phosphatase n=1 Tax=Actinomadura sp. 9N215 TaxID=3375150 RepID=UPI0037ACF179
MPLTINAAARSHIGLVRQRNEDSVYAGHSLFAVADGLGGHVAGDIASATAIEALRSCDRPLAQADLPAALGKAIRTANEALRKKIESDPELAGMGTTLVALLCSGGTAVLANVGDSRAYLLRDTTYRQITEDHTFGNLVAEAATTPSMSERITRFLDGRADGRSPDLTVRNLRPGDRFLLCSDGLSGVVAHDLVRETLLTSSAPTDTADHLVALAIDHGGPDNVTVLVIDVPGDL